MQQRSVEHDTAKDSQRHVHSVGKRNVGGLASSALPSMDGLPRDGAHIHDLDMTMTQGRREEDGHPLASTGVR